MTTRLHKKRRLHEGGVGPGLLTPAGLTLQRIAKVTKRVIVAFPPSRNSAELNRHASGSTRLGEDKLRQNLLPSPILTASGYELHRPPEWH